MGRSSSRAARRLSSMVVLLVFLAGCSSDTPDREIQGKPLMIFAAASLQDLVADLADELQKKMPREVDEPIKVIVSFAGSNTLAQQIMASPGADLFLSADSRWMNRLDTAGRLVDGSRREILSNRLVLVARQDTALEIDETRILVDVPFRHLALGDPEAVPAGRYARSALMHLGIWDQVADRALPSPNVRAALALVESDPEILGIVYQTDAMVSDRVKVLAHLDPIPEQAITYHGAIVRDGSNPEAAGRFLDLIHSPVGQAMLAKHGFLPAPAGHPPSND